MLPWWIVLVMIAPIAAVLCIVGFSNVAAELALAYFLLILMISLFIIFGSVLGRAPFGKPSPARILAGIWSPLGQDLGH